MHRSVIATHVQWLYPRLSAFQAQVHEGFCTDRPGADYGVKRCAAVFDAHVILQLAHSVEMDGLTWRNQLVCTECRLCIQLLSEKLRDLGSLLKASL